MVGLQNSPELIGGGGAPYVYSYIQYMWPPISSVVQSYHSNDKYLTLLCFWYILQIDIYIYVFLQPSLN